MRKKKSKKIVKVIALERIYRLFELASKNESYSKKYIELALKIARKNKVVIPKELKAKFCKKCFSYWNGSNVRIRKRPEYINYTCENCKAIKRVSL